MKVLIAFFSFLFILIIGFLIYAISSGGEGMFTTIEDRFDSGKLVHTETMSLADTKSIKISSRSDDIVFKQGTSDELVVKEYISGQSSKGAFVTYNDSGSSIKIESTKRNRSFMIFGNNSRCIEVYLPDAYDGKVTVNTTSADIESDDTLEISDLSIETTSGEVSMANVSTDSLDIGSTSGDIEVSGTIGDAKINSTSGEVELGEITGNISVNTTSGDVELRAAKLSGDMSIDTSSGEVIIRLPIDTSFDFEARTGSGEVESDFEDDLSYNKDGSSVKGTVGSNAKYMIKVHTSSGDVELNHNSH